MHKIGALLLLILLIVVIIFVSLEDEKTDTISIPVEDTTKMLIKKDQQKDKHSTPETNTSLSDQEPRMFTLMNTKNESEHMTVTARNVVLQNHTHPIVIINFFATWCPPCIGEVPYLSDLQKKYDKDLFVIGVLTHDTIDQSELERFMAKNQVNYFISNSKHNDDFANLLASRLNLPKNFPIPLTLIYVKGEYFTHYEGSVPVEMIEYDIQQAKKQL